MNRLEIGRTYKVFYEGKHIDTIRVTKLNFGNYYAIGQSTVTGQMANYSCFEYRFQDACSQMMCY